MLEHRFKTLCSGGVREEIMRLVKKVNRSMQLLENTCLLAVLYPTYVHDFTGVLR